MIRQCAYSHVAGSVRQLTDPLREARKDPAALHSSFVEVVLNVTPIALAPRLVVPSSSGETFLLHGSSPLRARAPTRACSWFANHDSPRRNGAASWLKRPCCLVTMAVIRDTYEHLEEVIRAECWHRVNEAGQSFAGIIAF